MKKPKNPNFDISSGIASRLTDDERNDLAAQLAATAVKQIGPGYLLAAHTLVQAAASVLATKMPPELAATMMDDLGRLMSQTIRENFCAPDGRRQ